MRIPGGGVAAAASAVRLPSGINELNRAIEEIQKDMKTKGYVLPPVPPYPNRNPTPRIV